MLYMNRVLKMYRAYIMYSDSANRRVNLATKSHLDEFLTFDPLGHIKMIGVISRVNCNRVIRL